MNNIYLIVGRSGSGKDTVVDYLCKHYGLSLGTHPTAYIEIPPNHPY